LNNSALSKNYYQYYFPLVWYCFCINHTFFFAFYKYLDGQDLVVRNLILTKINIIEELVVEEVDLVLLELFKLPPDLQVTLQDQLDIQPKTIKLVSIIIIIGPELILWLRNIIQLHLLSCLWQNFYNTSKFFSKNNFNFRQFLNFFFLVHLWKMMIQENEDERRNEVVYFSGRKRTKD
jgi:hypothetical protein